MNISDKDKEIIKKILSLEKINNRQKIFNKQDDIVKRIINFIKEGAEDEVQENHIDQL